MRQSERTKAKAPARRLAQTRSPIDQFAFDKAHGHTTTKHHLKAVLKACVGFHAIKSNHNPNCTVALALNPASGVLADTSLFTPDFLNRNPMMFKAKKGNYPDTPSMMEALSGEHRNEFMEAMKNKIAELEHHGTWKVVR